MTYFICVSTGFYKRQPWICGHTTLDHGEHGRGECLLEGCRCLKMTQGSEYVKPKRVHLPREEAIKLAATVAEEYTAPK